MSAELRMVEGEGDQGDPLTGTTIDGRYEVERVLGEGGMGLVYKAKHIILNKPLAIKVLRPDVSRDEEIITRFRQEAQSASAIGNQHIIDISDFGLLPDKSTYFVMEFLNGTDLTGAIEQGIETSTPMDAKRIVHIAKQLCRALGAAHEAGIVHRDLKPDNIYLIRRGGDSNFVKVLDFGIAKVGGNSSKLTRAGQVFGTPHYMSPEQCAGSGVDHRTDIYALGVILYEMCTGECPFDADNLMGILTKHLYEEPQPPRTKNPAVPEELEMVILKAMAKKLDERYQSMTELLEDLERVEAGVGTMARETTRSLALDTSEAPPPPSTSKASIIGAVVVLLVGGIGIGTYFAMSGGEEVVQVDGDPVTVGNDPVATETEPETPEVGQATETETETETEVEAPAAVMVAIDSDPSGAEVWRGAEFLGNTPFTVERPQGEDRMELSIQRAGYEDKEFVMSSRTATSVTLTLERSRSTSSMRVRMTAMAESAMATEPTPMMTETAMTMSSRPNSEVLNPWGSD